MNRRSFLRAVGYGTATAAAIAAVPILAAMPTEARVLVLGKKRLELTPLQRMAWSEDLACSTREASFFGNAARSYDLAMAEIQELSKIELLHPQLSSGFASAINAGAAP